MQGFHLPHRQSSLKEGRTIHYKVPLQYQPEEDLTVGQISDKEKIKTEAVAQKLVFCKKDVLRDFTKFTGKHPC